MILSFRTPTGKVVEGFEVADLLSVDGKPYQPHVHEDQGLAIAQLLGRLESLEQLVFRVLVPEPAGQEA